MRGRVVGPNAVVVSRSAAETEALFGAGAETLDRSGSGGQSKSSLHRT